MKVYRYPDRQDIARLTERPLHDATDLNATVAAVLKDVRERGDEAVMEYEERFDHARLKSLAVTEKEMDEAEAMVGEELRQAIAIAHANIAKFHAAQLSEGVHVSVTEGVECWQKPVPIEKVGLYIPGGTAPLFSTVLMLAVPARIAGCSQIAIYLYIIIITSNK